jgi:hypothetical protein
VLKFLAVKQSLATWDKLTASSSRLAVTEDAVMGDSPKKSVPRPWVALIVVVCAISAFVSYARMRYWWAHNNVPFAILNGIGLTFFVLLLVVYLSQVTGALGNYFDRLGDRIGVILHKLPSYVVAIVGAGFLIIGVLEIVLYVWCFFCLSFDLAVAVAVAGYYILKRKYSVPDF